MVTSVPDRHTLAQALDAGCSGFVSKTADRHELVAAVRAAADDDSYFTQDVLRHLVSLRHHEQLKGSELSDREVEVLQMTAEGLTADQISERLFLSSHTVKNHLRSIYGKLGVHNRTQAVAHARDLGLL